MKAVEGVFLGIAAVMALWVAAISFFDFYPKAIAELEARPYRMNGMTLQEIRELEKGETDADSKN